jgi:hypothetical protein
VIVIKRIGLFDLLDALATVFLSQLLEIRLLDGVVIFVDHQLIIEITKILTGVGNSVFGIQVYLCLSAKVCVEA